MDAVASYVNGVLKTVEEDGMVDCVKGSTEVKE